MYLAEIDNDFGFMSALPPERAANRISFKKKRLKQNLFPYFKSKIYTGNSITLKIVNRVPLNSINLKLTIENKAHFFWKRNTGKIKYSVSPTVDEALCLYFMVHTFLPLYFTVEDIYLMFHMSAVKIDTHACLFTAPSFGGKSTMVYHFLNQGHALVADDQLPVVAGDHIYKAVPSYPYCRHYRKSYDLGVKIDNFASSVLPIGAVYAISLVSPDAEISIREISGQDKFKILLRSCEYKVIKGHDAVFTQLRDMIDKVSIYALTVPKSSARLDDVYHVVMNHFACVRS